MLADALRVEVRFPIIFPVAVLHVLHRDRARVRVEAIGRREFFDACTERNETAIELVIIRQIRLHCHAPVRQILEHDARRLYVIKTRGNEIRLLRLYLDADFRPLQSLRAPFLYIPSQDWNKSLCVPVR